MGKKIKKCNICGKDFEVRFSGLLKYCSFDCANKGKANKLKKKRKKYAKNNKLKYGLREIDGSKVTLKCKNCDEKYTRYKSQVKWRGSSYCSRECKAEDTKKEDISIKSVDALWAKIVKLYADNKCEHCGKTKYLNSHHFYSRSKKSTRWLPINGICLCSGCHLLSSKFSAHKTPAEFVEWIREDRGEKWYEEVKKIANTPVTNIKGFKMDMYYNLKDIEDHLENE